jgi:predicted Zn-dependent protease
VDELLSVLFKHCHDLGILPASVKKSDIVLTYSDVSTNSNYHNLTMLSNGSLFMSESFLTRLLSLEGDDGLEALTFVLLHEIGHIAKKHNLRNLTDTYKWGDLRK